MSLHAFWGASRLSNTRSSSVTSRTSARQATDPNVPIRSTEATPDLEQTLHRSTCPPHSLSFRIDWSVLRRHDGTVLKGIHQLFAAESTTAAIQHLVEFHKVKRLSILAADDDDTEPGSAAAFQLVMPFNEEEYKQKLIDWVITLRLSYREVTNEATTELLTYGKPSLARLLPTHHSTLSQWVKDSLAARLPFVIKLVQSALSDINLSIDGWRAHNRREYVAICAHFVDSDGSPRTLLLGFPRRYGGHTGDDLAALVKPVILQYGIGEKLGFFVMDNAADNGKCLESL
ncbi:transposase-like protein [Beauveria brongniartii RCEF 3172]|uniref:Transposase-like protein n=1 Tax=Beauveria brongniartii RCEF 3172 TaxID=1081107 RepID=A0A167VFK3_9HYPO|nr:transposase-like protein [Beauveria brongniartii RCEF 3172]